MAHVLVTGADGFVGRFLVNDLLARGHRVTAGLEHKSDGLHSDVGQAIFDLLVPETVDALVDNVKPDVILHLAAQSMVAKSWDEPETTVMVNTVGTIHLVNAVARCSPSTKIITVGSSEEYGMTAAEGVPLTEDHSCRPQNPYASSKLAAGQIALQMARQKQLKLIHLRPFNHFGPGQREGFVVSDFASQIAKIEAKLASPIIHVGDLSARRDFTDVRDVVRAYILMVENEVESGVYNICSGIPRSAQEILDAMLALADPSIEVKVDPGRFRPSEVPLFVGSRQKLNIALGWEPIIDLHQSIRDTLDEWRRLYPMP